jgi:hypothetical protein
LFSLVTGINHSAMLQQATHGASLSTRLERRVDRTCIREFKLAVRTRLMPFALR